MDSEANSVDQSETKPSRLKIRSALDVRWMTLFLVGFVVSVAYYGALLWLIVWLVRAVLT